jgi:geranylgeranyl pyrophosphate synthase
VGYSEILDRYEGIIENDLRTLLDLEAERGRNYHPFIGKVYQSLQEFVERRGRRLAACSTLMVYKGYRGDINQRVVRVCSGIELYRHSILVHDDIVDNETMRRGGPALDCVLGEGYDSHLGKSSSLFAGNILTSMAIGVILCSGFDCEKVENVIGLLWSEYKDLNESQILDMLFEYKEPDVNEWQAMASKRASSLFKVTILAGANLASAPEKDIPLLKEAAEHIGFAFDIQDDIIDTFATREQYGRDPCGDISKRKKPLHIALALARDRRLASMMASPHVLSDEEIKEVQDVIRKCGALDEAKFISRAHAAEAQRLISETEMSDEAKNFFISFIKYVDESLDWYQ